MYYQAGNYHLITPRDWKVAIEKSVVTKSAEQPLSDSATVDADAIFLYLTEARYHSESSDILKRAIRRKAAVCVVRDGVLYVEKKKKDNSVSVQDVVVQELELISSFCDLIWNGIVKDVKEMVCYIIGPFLHSDISVKAVNQHGGRVLIYIV